MFATAIVLTATTETAVAMRIRSAVLNKPVRMWVLMSDTATNQRTVTKDTVKNHKEYRKKIVRWPIAISGYHQPS
ncbi:MAG TPA: hypothetical protein VFQ06_03925, partial [Nitrospira sp.]|nr:hypothetical protein [Nitrospira sp.]